MGIAAPAWAGSAAENQRTETTLLAVGDDLIHSGVYAAARTGHGYDFSPIFKHVKKDIKAADIAVINQETIFTTGSPSGYPCFGSPVALGRAIADAGFDVVQCATNHTMDRGSGAITSTIGWWEKHHPEIKVLGIHKSAKAARKITVVKSNGIKIAMLNYTYGLNGFSLPAGKGYLVDRLSSKSKIARDIHRAKKKADIVVVFGHMGTEYRLTPDSSQTSWARWFADHGVDLYVGTHPHVLEPVKWVKGNNGNKMLCYYSLGNFVSNQSQVATLLGGMAQVTIVKGRAGKVRIASWSITPLVTHKSANGKHYTVYKLSDYSNELAAKNRIRKQTSDTFTVASLKALFKKATGVAAK